MGFDPCLYFYAETDWINLYGRGLDGLGELQVVVTRSDFEKCRTRLVRIL